MQRPATRRGVCRCRAGATALEYGLIAGFFSIVMFLASVAVGDQLEGIFDRVAEALMGG